MVRMIGGWLGLFLLAGLCACGKGGGAAAADPAPFTAAVADYCRAKNYGMSVAEVVALAPAGDTATMTCKMKDAEELYGLAVAWEFSLRREGEGWTVVGHVQK